MEKIVSMEKKTPSFGNGCHEYRKVLERADGHRLLGGVAGGPVALREEGDHHLRDVRRVNDVRMNDVRI
jgi:hypothetical protein